MSEIIQTNFGEVVRGIYRSGFPSMGLYGDHLRGLSAIIKLVDVPYAKSIQNFVMANGIQVMTFILKPNKGQDKKHRTGCVVACFRKVQVWEHSAIIDEYRLYVGHKARPLDEEFIRLYEPGAISYMAYEASLAGWGQGQ
ncbi:hypothetical protein N7449_001585 [Penicillium cf. viridicatum]|uniref:Uncharacterized protein n=1 Tax=Penicillium cf. viridicatum TaxID=2972119 RepID=A0A9W9T9L0_9EURO|nr:hypothetical protein N7449_001585 [Penicillium cf. viridicatum]